LALPEEKSAEGKSEALLVKILDKAGKFVYNKDAKVRESEWLKAKILFESSQKRIGGVWNL